MCLRIVTILKREFIQRDVSMRAFWLYRQNCSHQMSHNVSQNFERIRRFSQDSAGLIHGFARRGGKASEFRGHGRVATPFSHAASSPICIYRPQAPHYSADVAMDICSSQSEQARHEMSTKHQNVWPTESPPTCQMFKYETSAPVYQNVQT